MTAVLSPLSSDHGSNEELDDDESTSEPQAYLAKLVFVFPLVHQSIFPESTTLGKKMKIVSSSNDKQDFSYHHNNLRKIFQDTLPINY